MKRIDLFNKLGLNGRLLMGGDSFEYHISDSDINIDNQEFLMELLDKVCISEGLIPLYGEWNSLSFSEAADLLLNAFRYDLAFASSEQMSLGDAQYFQGEILKGIDSSQCCCFTNWFQKIWQSPERASNPISECTFDIAIVIITPNKISFTYVLGED
jgi:hypothetical protein